VGCSLIGKAMLSAHQAPRIALDQAVAALKAAGEPTRLRILALLAGSDLTVKDLTAILGQSQPRISRHLKLLVEAGLVRRFPEGAWAYYRLGEGGEAAQLATALIDRIDFADPVVARDRVRLEAVKRAHAEAAAAYFAANAASWDELRSLHVAEADVEAAMREALGPKPFDSLLDLGTGTGRVLELLRDLYRRGVGVDASQPMLAVARANLDRAGIGNAQVRHGDVYALALQPGSFDVVTVHQVLHFLDDPAHAVHEAARALRPGGRLLIVDFAPHDLEFLRADHAHRRLGFSHDEVAGWIAATGLELASVRDLRPPPGSTGKLTVTLWLARDPRLLVAAARTDEMESA
jgi:ubiquinone/menaquinone biosynthesis C-methylase UbiE/DNA-binding HxlR family transcriptional regulator